MSTEKKVINFPLSPATIHEKNKLDFIKALDEFLTEHKASLELYLEGNNVCIAANINDYQERVKFGSMVGNRKINHMELEETRRIIEDKLARYLELDERNARFDKKNNPS